MLKLFCESRPCLKTKPKAHTFQAQDVGNYTLHSFTLSHRLGRLVRAAACQQGAMLILRYLTSKSCFTSGCWDHNHYPFTQRQIISSYRKFLCPLPNKGIFSGQKEKPPPTITYGFCSSPIMQFAHQRMKVTECICMTWEFLENISGLTELVFRI